nr:sensor domain-containing diguanylate cyclase [Desulfobulbaceae bacterium]
MNQISTYIKNKIRRFSNSIPENAYRHNAPERNHVGPASEAIGSIFDTKNYDDHAAEKFFDDSFQLQLSLLKSSLSLSSVLVVFKNDRDGSLDLHSFSSQYPKKILSGPYPAGIGIAGAMNQGHDAVFVSDLNTNYSGIFYYKELLKVGAAAIIQIFSQKDVSGGMASTAFLCIDRADSTPWTDNEKKIIALAAKKIGMDLQLGKMLTSLDQKGNLIQKICQGFRELNKGLGLETVFNATYKAVTSLVNADFISISLLVNDSHQTAFVAGTDSQEHHLGLEFNLNEGLVGQVIRLNRPLPVNGQYSGPAPVFSKKQCLTGYSSLYILPLLPEEGQSLGAMTVASKNAAAFGLAQMDILQLIATQVAVKIELAKSHETINKMATTDGLTDLANHRTFQHGFDIMLHRAKRRQSPLTLIFCDIDFFKKINDSYGHQFGDQVLKAVAKILSDTVRREDMAARYGGEEFALILENSSKSGALQMAERIRHDIADLTFQFENESVGLTISLGIASFPEDGQEKTTIIELADQALYKAKRQGRNQSVVA